MSYLVGAKGQVVIPKGIRDALNITAGQEVVFERRGDEVILRAAQKSPLKARFPQSALTDELIRAREDDKALETT